jgi:hypothetical protein
MRSEVLTAVSVNEPTLRHNPEKKKVNFHVVHRSGIVLTQNRVF